MEYAMYKYHVCGECIRYRETPEGDSYCLCEEWEQTRGTHEAFEEACKDFEKAKEN